MQPIGLMVSEADPFDISDLTGGGSEGGGKRRPGKGRAKPRPKISIKRVPGTLQYGHNFASTVSIRLCIDSRSRLSCDVLSPVILRPGAEVRIFSSERFMTGKVTRYIPMDSKIIPADPVKFLIRISLKA